MKDFRIFYNEDGSLMLVNRLGESLDDPWSLPEGQASVAATARTDDGRAYWVRTPVTKQMIESQPDAVEKRLRLFAERFVPPA